jgi:hypothetical protein
VAKDWKWRCRALLPRSAKARSHFVHALNSYLTNIRDLYPGSTCTMEESPTSPHELFIHFEWGCPPNTEELELVQFKVQKDINFITTSYLGETGPIPKSVWEWLRVKDPYADG